MTQPFIYVGAVFAALTVVILVGLLVDRPTKVPGGPDAEYFAEIGVQEGDEPIAVHPDEEKAERRFRLAHIRGHMTVARIGRRPRP